MTDQQIERLRRDPTARDQYEREAARRGRLPVKEPAHGYEVPIYGYSPASHRRKISSDAVSAFLARANFSRSNTSCDGLMLFLYGRAIARWTETTKGWFIEISDAGWDTATTKERLNTIPGVNVFHSKGIFHLNGIKWTGHWARILNVDTGDWIYVD